MPNLHMLKRSLCLVALSVSLTGCAAPPALQLLSLALDGISYMATDKTVADHGLSIIAQKDCKMLRTFQDEDICLDDKTEKEKEAPILLSEKPSVPAE